MMLSTEAECQEFLENQNPRRIAQQLQQDQKACRDLRLPSLLVLYLPSPKCEAADVIALELFPQLAGYARSIRQTQYSGMINGMKAYLRQMKAPTKHENLPDVLGNSAIFPPSKQNIDTALKVLSYCLTCQPDQVNLKTPLSDIITILQQEASGQTTVHGNIPQLRANSAAVPIGGERRNCYICQFRLCNPHSQYPSLCKPCGDFNLASCSLSLPEKLRLEGRTALVTGARVNLGFHTALRLLRCGASVIVTSRYPQDAEERYLAEKDSDTWTARLRIVGADFRVAADVFDLVFTVRHQLSKWAAAGDGKLDILINNAAQTLTDPIEKEVSAVKQEARLIMEVKNDHGIVLCERPYEARVRGGAMSRIESSQASGDLKNTGSLTLGEAQSGHNEKLEVATLSKTSKSSWMQSLHQIPYEDVISAHSVNTFVPLILIRELMPHMGQPRSQSSASESEKLLRSSNTVPAAYIINVSSREGIFENSPDSSSKNGKHVHTNLTKAALNMLTETEAAPAWKDRRVAMNSVDPGYMSAAPEIEKHRQNMRNQEQKNNNAAYEYMGENGKGNSRWEYPIGWEDGAGRVLWPVAVGEMGKGPVWGRFLKHFGQVEVNIGVGR